MGFLQIPSQMMSCQMKRKTIRHKFVDLIPNRVEEGMLYISIPYATATHKCACGCGEIVVTPIRPTDWTVIWDRDTITITPSIGNWSLPCQSHYIIRNNKVIWARKWSDSKIKAGRAADKMIKELYYGKFRKPRKD